MKRRVLLGLLPLALGAQPAGLGRNWASEAAGRAAGMTMPGPSPGSVFTPAGRLADPARDLRAGQVDDIVTIRVLDRASAVSRGATNTQRKATAAASVPAMGGQFGGSLGAKLTGLLDLSGAQQLQGQGLTSRETNLSATVTARVVAVLPNGNLLVEGLKEVQVNSERQSVAVRGVVRPADLTAGNVVSSDRVADLEIRVNGKGVVGDAIRRPNFLYRLLLGLLPF
jgi:flagellar L-ring protein precursor FlgH